ncbi:MAG: FAD-binding protein [Planctomycetes bacterium]|nr:FAD-binding protein [Planctomycetota bacterium]MBI3836208.1 FAD-binding protein [Planctomycetota bacterium]
MSHPTRDGALSPLASELEAKLKASVEGDVRFDRLSRTLYSTDASIYEIIPLGVVSPRGVADIVTTVNLCREAGVPIVARGGGTGLAGGAVGFGAQLDLSRYMNRIGELNVAARTIEVEPGVVLDELNAHLAPHGLRFAPDVATSSRATIGGMIANNSCGANSVVYGRTVDHVQELTIILSDRSTLRFAAFNDRSQQSPDSIESKLGAIRDANHAEIQRRFPKVMRSNGGYGLDRLGVPGTPIDATKILCGSEGTLGVIASAKLKLVPLPKTQGLVVLHFRGISEALRTTPRILEHKPSSVELIDRLIINAGRKNAALAERLDFLQGEPEALLVVEFFADDEAELNSRIEMLCADQEISHSAFAAIPIVGPKQADVWKLRTSGLGLLMSRPGDAQPYSFVEDSAVDPSRLADYIERLQRILEFEGVHAGFYAHASVGCIHVKPVLNLKSGTDIEKMRRIADAASDLALEFGGAMTGEHGDGIVRSYWLEKMYGPQIMNAFRAVKQLFDPHDLFNPHKIVDPWPMTKHLRQGPDLRSLPVKTTLDFDEHGGMAGLAGMCTGVGQCRQNLVGTMCPSFMATGDETHTTRARANALRIALSNRGLLNGLNDPCLDEVMDLCIGCKACKTECPTGVDMARLKAEFLHHRNLVRGSSERSRLISGLPTRLASASRFPRIANLISQSSWMRAYLDRRYGIDARVAPPMLARRTFRSWWRAHHCDIQKHRNQPESRKKANTDRGQVVYFLDTWTNYFCPQVGIATIKLLERAGYEVFCPSVRCCGRPAISQGLLGEATELATFNVDRLSQWAASGTPIVGTEPSCLLTLVDEYPQLIRTNAARRVAKQSRLVESLLCETVSSDSNALAFRSDSSVRFHAHCHQKAIVGTADARTLMQFAFGDGASEISSGCCGMAGAFGHEKEHYDVARAIGEQRLFPAIRERGRAKIAISGFSCRHQIETHTDARPRHLAEYLADALI